MGHLRWSTIRCLFVVGECKNHSFDFQTEKAATEVGSGLIQLGEKHGQDTFVGIYAMNSVEVRWSIAFSLADNTPLPFSPFQWMTAALACHFHSMIYVPLYDTLGEPAIVHIINQSKCRALLPRWWQRCRLVLQLRWKRSLLTKPRTCWSYWNWSRKCPPWNALFWPRNSPANRKQKSERKLKKFTSKS